MNTKLTYDSTVARMAGNIAGSMLPNVATMSEHAPYEFIAKIAVRLARLIVAECERTEPALATNAVDPQAQPHTHLTPRDFGEAFENASKSNRLAAKGTV